MDFRGKDICIIGGGGFLGTALREFFSNQGCRLVTIGRSRNVAAFTHEQYFSVQEYAYAQLTGVLTGMSFLAVIDLAYSTVPGTSYLDPVGDFSDNLGNVIRYPDFVRNLRVEKYLYVSSGGTVYGDATAQKPFDEEDPTIPLSPYGITKLACERYVLMYQRLYNVPAIILRPANIYGPGQKPFREQGLIATAFGLALRNETLTIYGTGGNVRDYLYVSDFCNAVAALCISGSVGQIYNIGSAEGISITEIIKNIDAVLAEDGRQLGCVHRPDRPFDVQYSVLDTSKLRRATTWSPRISLQTGLRNAWQWIKSQNLSSTVV